jgi:hypothetical protein
VLVLESYAGYTSLGLELLREYEEQLEDENPPDETVTAPFISFRVDGHVVLQVIPYFEHVASQDC